MVTIMGHSVELTTFSHMVLFLDFMVTMSHRYYWNPILQTMILRIEGMYKGRWVRKRSSAPTGHEGFYFPWFPVNDSDVCSSCVSQHNSGPFYNLFVHRVGGFISLNHRKHGSKSSCLVVYFSYTMHTRLYYAPRSYQVSDFEHIMEHYL